MCVCVRETPKDAARPKPPVEGKIRLAGVLRSNYLIIGIKLSRIQRWEVHREDKVNSVRKPMLSATTRRSTINTLRDVHYTARGGLKREEHLHSTPSHQHRFLGSL